MVPSSICADAPLLCFRGVTAVVLRRVGARQRGRGATVEGARILAFVLTIPFGGCEPHVWGWFLPVFWGGFGAWVKPKIKFAWFVRNIYENSGFCSLRRR